MWRHIFLFSILISISHATCTESIKQDCIFLVDYSSSIDDDEWQLQLDFAATLVTEHLPDDSRIAFMGFGAKGSSVADGWVFDYDDVQVNGVTDKAEAARRIRALQQKGGYTYLEAGIRYLLDDSPISNQWNQYTNRKRLLVIISDGVATDDPCTTVSKISEKNIHTIVIGVSSGFRENGVTCLVDDPSTDIIKATNFVDLSNIIDDVGTQTCLHVDSFSLGESNLLMYGNGPVCDDNFTDNIANLICKEMGFDSAESHTPRQVTGTNDFTMDAINCNGKTSWDQCTFSTREDCSDGEGVDLVCHQDSTTEESSFSLGANNLLMYGDGPVCDDDWNQNIANLICKKLGFASAESYETRQSAGTSDFTMDEINCDGKTSWDECTFSKKRRLL